MINSSLIRRTSNISLSLMGQSSIPLVNPKIILIFGLHLTTQPYFLPYLSLIFKFHDFVIKLLKDIEIMCSISLYLLIMRPALSRMISCPLRNNCDACQLRVYLSDDALLDLILQYYTLQVRVQGLKLFPALMSILQTIRQLCVMGHFMDFAS